MKTIIPIIIIAQLFIGCAALDKLYVPDQSTDTQAQGQMTLRPAIRSVVSVAGDVVPVPWGGLAASALLNVLGAYGSLRGRRWKQATTSSVAAANEFRTIVKKTNPELYREIKERIIGNQNADGTRNFIKAILNKLT